MTQPTYIAIIDDDEHVCRSLGRFLAAANMQSVTYASAEAFLADKKRPHFDCLLVDVQLGGMSGIELGETLLSKGVNAPFICITAHDEPEVRARAEAAGCAAFFLKTDAGVKLLTVIRRLVH
jgi:FixJ family two-component response regulator